MTRCGSACIMRMENGNVDWDMQSDNGTQLRKEIPKMPVAVATCTCVHTNTK